MDVETLWRVAGNVSVLIVALLAGRVAWEFTKGHFED
jgi:hypothetical protein